MRREEDGDGVGEDGGVGVGGREARKGEEVVVLARKKSRPHRVGRGRGSDVHC